MAGKTRVTVEIGGIARELFSIEERKSGDLMLFLKASAAIAIADGAEHEDVAEQRFSVHVSPKSQGHTIKQTLRTRLGQTTTSAFVLPVGSSARSPAGLVLPDRRRFCWPVYMARPPRLDSGRYDSTPKPADRNIALEPFDPSIASLVYMVAATSTDIATLPDIRKRTSLVTLPFASFNLHVRYGFCPVAALPFGHFLTFATGSQLKGGEAPSSSRQPRVSLHPPAIEGAFIEGLGVLRDRFARHFLGVKGEGIDEAGAATMMWGLSAFCLAKPPKSAKEIMPAFDAYMAEVKEMSASLGRIGQRRQGVLPDWLEEARRRHEGER
jgi:hypothetical protein